MGYSGNTRYNKDIEYVYKNMDYMSTKELAEKLNRTIKGIQRLKAVIKLQKRKDKTWK